MVVDGFVPKVPWAICACTTVGPVESVWPITPLPPVFPLPPMTPPWPKAVRLSNKNTASKRGILNLDKP